MNEYEKKGFYATRGSINAILRLFFVFLVMYFIYILFNINGTNSTDASWWNRSGLSLYTDAQTGMQYLYKDGSLIPRLDVAGNHVGIQVNKK